MVTEFDKYKMSRLRAKRFWLEPLTAHQHAEALFAPLSDSRLYTFLPGDPPKSLQVVWDRFARLEGRGSARPPQAEAPIAELVQRARARSELWLNWVIKSKSRNYVGLVEATVRRDDSVQLAYFVFVDYQGQGYGVEAVKLVLDHLTETLGLTRARALVDTRNKASQRLLERLGFERTRVIKNADHFKGASSDEYEYARAL